MLKILIFHTKKIVTILPYSTSCPALLDVGLRRAHRTRDGVAMSSVCFSVLLISELDVRFLFSSLRRVKMDQRKLMDNANTLVDMAKVGSFTNNCQVTVKFFSHASSVQSYLGALSMIIDFFFTEVDYPLV